MAYHNEKALAVACMFHDYYLYDIKDEHLGPWHHGTRHASIAIRNAEKVYPLNNLEKEIIRSHMWPLNITQIPASREAWLVCLADKVCAVEEMFPFLATKKSHLSDSVNSKHPVSNSAFPEFDNISSHPASMFIDGCIMFLGGVDILMSKGIRHKINIPRFLIKRCTEGASKLMRGYFFDCGDKS